MTQALELPFLTDIRMDSICFERLQKMFNKWRSHKPPSKESINSKFSKYARQKFQSRYLRFYGGS